MDAVDRSSHRAGRHFLQIPGPTNIPEAVLSAIRKPVMDHRGQEFAALTKRIFERLKEIFGSSDPVLIFPSSGTGAWEAALVNTLSPGDRILAFETGYFALLWAEVAKKLGLDVELVPGDWRRGVDPVVVQRRLSEDASQSIKVVMVVHNETSTGVTSRIPAIRSAMNACEHPALLLVDTISSLGSMDYRHEEWGVDVTVGGSQKGLMLPPGLGFNVVSAKALAAAEGALLPRSYWNWHPILKANESGFFPFTPATNLLYGLDAALDLLLGEGLEHVFARHARHASATRRAVKGWGLENQCLLPEEYSDSLTAIRLPDSFDSDRLRAIILDRFDLSLGTGLGKVKGRLFRIGHLGDLNDLTLMGTLCGVEMGLNMAGVPLKGSGVAAALKFMEGGEDGGSE